MIKYIKFIIIFVLILFIAIPFAGSYSVQSVDDLAYLVALGIDEGDTNELKVTFEFTMPNSSGESSSSEVAPTIINSVDASSLDSAINLMNTYVSKEISLSHCKAIIISESLASNGISKLLYSLMNKVQIRPDTNVIVSKCLAKDFIENTKPNLENLIAKYYEIAPMSSEYTGYTANIKLGNFFNQLSCQTCEPFAMLGAISTSSNAQSLSNPSTIGSNETSSTAGSTPLGNTGTSEMLGLAAFKGDKLVGELSALETLCHLIIRDDVESFNITIPNPENEVANIDLYVYHKSKPKIKVNLVNGSPFIQLDIKLEAKILSVDNVSHYMTEQRLSEISASANQYIQQIMSDYLYTTSKEFKSDIDGFGKYASKHFLTTKDFQEYNWLENYQNAFFDINVSTDVQSALLLSGQ